LVELTHTVEIIAGDIDFTNNKYYIYNIFTILLQKKLDGKLLLVLI